MDDIYISGKYLETTSTWHAEDSPWKASQIKKIIDRNRLKPNNIAGIGCGSGSILDELSKQPDLQHVCFEGFDISPQAIEIAKKLESKRVKFSQEDILYNENGKQFDILLVIDVFERSEEHTSELQSH